jgi:hypothetical protein
MTLLEVAGGLLILVICVTDWYVVRALTYTKWANMFVLPLAAVFVVFFGLVVAL